MARNTSALSGNEPDVSLIDGNDPKYNINLMRVMNWYSAEKLKSDARRFTRDYVKAKLPTELKTFDEIKDVEIINTFGWIARVIMLGGSISDNHLAKFNNYIRRILDSTIKTVEPVVQVVTTSAPRVSIQDAMKEKISEYIGELEGCLDKMVQDKEDFSLYKHMQANHIPKPYVADVKEWSKKNLREFIAAYEGKDVQLNEGYSYLTKRELKNIVKTLAQCIEDCDKYSEFKKANRKPRVAKPKAPGIQVKSLKFKRSDTELGLQSVSATEIIGAQQVWLYNTKTRKLVLYRSESGFQVKGSSIQNYEPEQSIQKTLRKPAEQIKAMMVCGKVQLRKFMDTINAKEQPANGRINAEMIILKAIK